MLTTNTVDLEKNKDYLLDLKFCSTVVFKKLNLDYICNYVDNLYGFYRNDIENYVRIDSELCVQNFTNFTAYWPAYAHWSNFDDSRCGFIFL